jgi:hypothetical protein
MTSIGTKDVLIGGDFAVRINSFSQIVSKAREK